MSETVDGSSVRKASQLPPRRCERASLRGTSTRWRVAPSAIEASGREFRPGRPWVSRGLDRSRAAARPKHERRMPKEQLASRVADGMMARSPSCARSRGSSSWLLAPRRPKAPARLAERRSHDSEPEPNVLSKGPDDAVEAFAGDVWKRAKQEATPKSRASAAGPQPSAPQRTRAASICSASSSGCRPATPRFSPAPRPPRPMAGASKPA